MIAIAVGAGLGAMLRWVLAITLNALWPVMPLGTLAANLIGGLLIGIAYEFFTVHAGVSPEWRLFLITGFMGGLTTFSTFSLEVSAMLMSRQLLSAALTLGVHVIGSIGLTLAGIALVQYFTQR